MNTRSILLIVCLVLGLAMPIAAQTNKTAVVQFYQAYLTLVSASDYVTISRDEPEVWDARFDSIARNAGFSSAADALAAGEALSGDNDVATLRQQVASTILQQYTPYKE